jgi:RNA polymerase sigma factor (sigma-70 family)
MPPWVERGLGNRQRADVAGERGKTAEAGRGEQVPGSALLTLAERFTTLLLSHRRTITAIVFRCGQRYGIRGAETDDLLQDVLLEGWRSYVHLDTGTGGPRSFVSWMEKVAQSTVAGIHRRQQASKRDRRGISGPTRRLGEAPEPSAHWETPALEVEELGALVGRAVSRLPPALKDIVQDRFYAGLSLREIAAHQQCSATHALRLLRRALADLRGMLPEIRR